MGDRMKCEFECKQALLAGREVVIDRCNFDERQRATWVRIAHEGSHRGPVFVMGLHFDLPVSLCIQRAQGRTDHPTLNGIDVVDVIQRFNGMFQKVSRREGFMEVYRAVQQQDIDNFVRFLGPAMSYPSAFSTPEYAAPGMPQGHPHPLSPAHPSNPTHMQPNPQLGTPPHRPGTRNPPIVNGSQRQQQQAQQKNSTPADVHSNIVPFRKAQSPGNPNQPGGITGGFVDEATGQDTRPILLFDLNGTLTSHTAAKRSAGRSLMRPGIHHLRRLQEHFRLGIFTSATVRTATEVLPQLEAAAGPGPLLFSDKSLLLHRGHTAKASEEHVKAGGNKWDTCKPLHRWFKHLHRVLLMDDDAYKALPGEENNMINIHCWEEEEPEDMHLELVVDILLTNYQGLARDDDVRTKSQNVSDALKAAVAANVALHSHGEGELEEADELMTGSALEHNGHSAGILQPT
ncbi:hypothetical protein ABBQ32_006145 [Trebouxia sp. C0010 RCD-2024]